MNKSVAIKKGETRVGKRGAACIFLAVCVLFSMFVLGGSKLGSLRSNAYGYFNSGEESITADLTKHNENAYNILTVGKRVLGETNATVQAADAAYKTMNGAKTPAAMYAADNELDVAIASLVSELSTSGWNDKDKKVTTAQKADMDSRDMIISHNEYNAKVSEYNATVGGFPAGLIAAVRGLGALEYYR